MDNNNLGSNIPTNSDTQGAPLSEPTVVPYSEPTVVPQNQNTLTPIEPAKSNKKPIIMVVVAVLVLAIAGVIVYFAFFKKVNKTVVKDTAINTLFMNAIKVTDELHNNMVVDYKKDIFGATGKVKATIETNDDTINQYFNNIKSAELEYDLRLDLKTLSGSLDLSEKENDQVTATINAFIKDKMLYVKSDALGSVYKYDLSNEFDWDSFNVNNLPDYQVRSLSNMLSKMNVYLKNAIKDDYITQEEGSYTIDGTTFKGVKTTITLTKERTQEIYKSILDQMLNDPQAIEYISEYTLQSEEEVKAELDQAKTKIEDSYSETVGNKGSEKDIAPESGEELYVNIYTTKLGEFLGFDFITNEKNKTGIEIVKENNVSRIKLYNNNKTVLELEYNHKEKELSWTNKEEKNQNEKIVIKFQDKGIKVTFTMNGLKVVVETAEEINADEAKSSINASLNYEINESKLDATLDYNNVIAKAEDINEFNVSSAVESKVENMGSDLENIASKSIVFKMLLPRNVEATNQVNYMENSTYCSQAFNCTNCANGVCECEYCAGVSGDASSACMTRKITCRSSIY